MRLTNLDGQPIRSGRSLRRLDAEFLDGNTPAWLTAPEGTLQVIGLGAGVDRSCAQVTTAAAVGARATLQGPPINWLDAHAIHFTAEALFVDDDAAGRAQLEVAVASQSGYGTGAMLSQGAAETQGTLRVYRQAQPSVDTLIPFNVRQKHSLNLGLSLYPRSGELAVTDGDQELYWGKPQAPWGWALGGSFGNVVPRISVQSLDGVAHKLDIRAFRIALETN